MQLASRRRSAAGSFNTINRVLTICFQPHGTTRASGQKFFRIIRIGSGQDVPTRPGKIPGNTREPGSKQNKNNLHLENEREAGFGRW